MENLKKLAETKEQKEIAELKMKPEINPHSKKIGKRNQPVHERTEKYLTEKKKQMETDKAKLEKERADKIAPELTFAPKINTVQAKRSNEEYFDHQKKWDKMKKEKNERKKLEIEGKIKETLKFTPEINANSVNIVDALGVKKPIEQRLLEKMEYVNKKKQALRDEQPFSFMPAIEENSRMIAKHKIEGDVFNRLFDLSKEQEIDVRSPKFAALKNRSFSFSNDLEEDPQKKIELLFDLS
jgi:hypothetical protein